MCLPLRFMLQSCPIPGDGIIDLMDQQLAYKLLSWNTFEGRFKTQKVLDIVSMSSTINVQGESATPSG